MPRKIAPPPILQEQADNRGQRTANEEYATWWANVDLRGRRARFPRAKYQFNIRVKFSMKSEGFKAAQEKLLHVLDPDVMGDAIRQAVVRSLVANMRLRFIRHMTNALEMESLEVNGRAPNSTAQKRMQDKNLQDALNRLMHRLNEAQIDGDLSAADGIRERMLKVYEKLHASLELSPKGQPLGSHALSKLVGNEFRRRMFMVLQLLTDRHFVGVVTRDGKITVNVGNIPLLDRIQTPSATERLTGRPTSSRFKILWRHLEFGTGLLRSTQKDRRNSVTKGLGSWWYGRILENSLQLRGTLPMNFITNNNGEFYEEDLAMLRQEITKSITALLTA